MKQAIHPQFYPNATVICQCGNTFTTGSTQEVIRVELCSKCHPFYTGEQRFVDSKSKIQRFQQKQQAAAQYVAKKKEKQSSKPEGPKTLREMLEALK